MPVIIIVVAFLILAWSQWSQRQALTDMSSRVRGLISDLCSGNAPERIRWADSTIREAVIQSVDDLCSADQEAISIVAVSDQEVELPYVEIRISMDNRNVMTLQIESLPEDTLLVRGWSSE
ncbi:MAG: hypothetical protein CMJ29_01895 [Phycisphaerae bacterium]|nr:hypothetical protein [Phycisphaerae bacterium]MAT80382.1 hypothetical protein [Phycisphaerae bacterium]|tara:strand:- start:795 stop:1157 length:363 start_codon:yes stop_codon:yes gene_type:complete